MITPNKTNPPPAPASRSVVVVINDKGATKHIILGSSPADCEETAAVIEAAALRRGDTVERNGRRRWIARYEDMDAGRYRWNSTGSRVRAWVYEFTRDIASGQLVKRRLRATWINPIY